MIQKTAFEILQSKLTIEDTFDFREKHIPEILEAMEEYKAQPIELPSNEEIEKLSRDVIVYNDTKRGWFIEGAQWMRDKIQGGNQ
jgi:hypothetical protein